VALADRRSGACSANCENGRREAPVFLSNEALGGEGERRRTGRLSDCEIVKRLPSTMTLAGALTSYANGELFCMVFDNETEQAPAEGEHSRPIAAKSGTHGS